MIYINNVLIASGYLGCPYCFDHSFTIDDNGKIQMIKHIGDLHFPGILLSDVAAIVDHRFSRP